MRADWLRGDHASVHNSTTAKQGSVGVNQLAIAARDWRAYPVAIPWHRREVTDNNDQIVMPLPPAGKRNNTLRRVAPVNPLEPIGGGILFIQRRCRAHRMVERHDKVAHLPMARDIRVELVEQAPIEETRIVP